MDIFEFNNRQKFITESEYLDYVNRHNSFKKYITDYFSYHLSSQNILLKEVGLVSLSNEKNLRLVLTPLLKISNKFDDLKIDDIVLLNLKLNGYYKKEFGININKIYDEKYIPLVNRLVNEYKNFN